ncbi:MAG: coproporphyrinogen III oxidase [Leptolyngbya sp. SIO4C1]|nr:coproporphyrinogen III oxidase [Leptolyngbya sp. SIO4C1]
MTADGAACSPVSAYIHVPFCRRRCFYCDFPISVIGERQRGETSGTIAQYVDWLRQEIAATPSLGGALKTVFFGGGTPSLLAVSQLEKILTALQQQFGIASSAEISMEMDPGTFDLAHLQGYRDCGVNRVSLGVQAFQDRLLEACGRFHRTADVYRAAEDLQQVQISSWSLDLISGLPYQTMADWAESLTAAIALSPQHVSVYDLTLEPQTPFGKFYAPDSQPLPPEATTVEMYCLAQQSLTAAGYDHYEISNYARPGHQCQHNLTYWHNQPYYGFGMGATSYTQQQRCSRPRTRAQYADWLKAYAASGAALDCDPTPPAERILDWLMVGLRLAKGVPLAPLRQLDEAVVPQLRQCLASYLDRGQVHLSGDRLWLSDPEGFLVSNAILADLFNLFDSEA